MFRYFERLRQKPRDERKRIATFWAVGITLIIIFAWLPVFFLRLERFGLGAKNPNVPVVFLDSLREVSAGLLEVPGIHTVFPGTEVSSSPSTSTASSSEEETRVLEVSSGSDISSGAMEEEPGL